MLNLHWPGLSESTRRMANSDVLHHFSRVMASMSSGFHEGTGALGQRAPAVLGRSCRDQLVKVPIVLAFGGFLHLEQIDGMDLAPVFPDPAGAEAIVVGRHGFH